MNNNNNNSANESDRSETKLEFVPQSRKWPPNVTLRTHQPFRNRSCCSPPPQALCDARRLLRARFHFRGPSVGLEYAVSKAAVYCCNLLGLFVVLHQVFPPAPSTRSFLTGATAAANHYAAAQPQQLLLHPALWSADVPLQRFEHPRRKPFIWNLLI